MFKQLKRDSAMRILVSVIFILGALHRTRSEEVRLLNLDPPEAQQYIDKQDTSLKYAPKIESNVPAVRFLGNEPHNVVEDIYLANQYHGQDGLGGYLYGYAVPDIAKTEKKKAGGDLRGAYNYIAGNGQEIKVEYWDDGTGFHQVDNVPKILPKQIDDTPEVKAAKEEHQRIWNEQAERNSRPIENPYDSHFNYAQGPLSPQSQAQQLVNQYQQQRQQFPNPGQNVHYQGDQSAQYQGQPSQSLNRYQPAGQISGAGSQGSAQFGSQPASGSGQYGGSQPGSGPGGAQFGSRPSGSGQYGASQSSGSQSSGGAASGPFGGSRPSGSGQYGSQSSSGGQFGSSRPGSGQYGAGSQSSGSGQYGGQSSSGGQFGSSGSASGQYGAGQPSGAGSQASGSGQYPAGVGGPSAGSGQYGQSASGGQFGASSGGASGQYGAGVGGASSGSGQYGQSGSGGQSGAASGQYGAGHSSGGGQFGGSRPSGSGQYGGSLSSGGAGQYGGAGQGSSSSGQYGGKYSGSSSQSSGQYSAEGSEGKWNEEEEEKGPPKGFFYNFDYPVGIIVQKDGGSIQKREGDLKDIYTTNKANFEKQLQLGQADRPSRSATGYLVV